MTLEDMFSVAQKKNLWGIDGYFVPKLYEDPLRSMAERKLQEEKKKGHITTLKPKELPNKWKLRDKAAERSKNLPGPNKYQIDNVWAKPITKKPKKDEKPQSKHSFLDQIYDQAKKAGTPGVGKYNLRRPQDEIEKQLKELKKKKIR